MFSGKQPTSMMYFWMVNSIRSFQSPEMFSRRILVKDFSIDGRNRVCGLARSPAMWCINVKMQSFRKGVFLSYSSSRLPKWRIVSALANWMTWSVMLNFIPLNFPECETNSRLTSRMWLQTMVSHRNWTDWVWGLNLRSMSTSSWRQSRAYSVCRAIQAKDEIANERLRKKTKFRNQKSQICSWMALPVFWGSRCVSCQWHSNSSCHCKRRQFGRILWGKGPSNSPL